MRIMLSPFAALALLLVALAPAELASGASVFLFWATDSSMSARSLDQLACERAQDAAIRAFACQEAADEAQASARLKSLSKALDREPSSTIGEPERERDRAIGALEGGAFDDEYMHERVNDLARSLALYEDATREVSDPSILGYIAEQLPALERRYDVARQVQMRLASTAPLPWGSGRSNDHQTTAGPVPSFPGY